MLHRQYEKWRSRRDYKITEQIYIASFPQINCNLIQVIPKNHIWLHATISKSEQILSIHSFIHSHSTNLKLLTDILSIRSVWLQDMIMHFSYSWKCSSGPLQPPPSPATLPKELMQEKKITATEKMASIIEEDFETFRMLWRSKKLHIKVKLNLPYCLSASPSVSSVC